MPHQSRRGAILPGGLFCEHSRRGLIVGGAGGRMEAMPNIPKKRTPAKKSAPAKADRATVVGKAKARKVAKSGLTSRTLGNVSARGRRAQAHRDSH